MFQMLRVLLLGLLTISMLGCVSSGVVPIGKDTYMSSKNAPPQAAVSSLQADLYLEGNQFCQDKGLEFQPLSEQGVDGIMFARNTSAQIKFRCLQKGDPELNRPTMKPVANVIIENNIQEKKESKEMPAQQSDDMYVELKKLKELLDTGVITQAEFDTKKKRILAK